AETIADAIERFDHFEIVVNRLELLAQTLDMAVNRAVIHIDLLIISRIHEGVTTFHHSGTLCQRMKDQEFGDGQRDRFALPGASVALLIHNQLTTLKRFCLLSARLCRTVARGNPAKHGLDTLDQKTLREWLG